MVKQETWNPISKEWELLTPAEWKRIKAGYHKNADVEEYELDFKINPIHSLKQYTKTEHDETVALFFIDLFIKMHIISLTPTEMLKFSIWCRSTFYYPEIRAFYGPIFKLRKALNEASKLLSESSSTSSRHKRNRRK